MTIVRLKTNRDHKVNELLSMFNLPHYQAKPSVGLVGGSAAAVGSNANPTEATRLKAVNELLRWTRPR